MKFHFFGSLEGDKENYRVIFDCLEKLECHSINHHVLHRKIDDITKETAEESEAYVKRMISWVQKADFIVFEVTLEEVSLGYEMMLALNKGKPVIVLYQADKGKIPFTLKGVTSDRLFIYSYEKERIYGLEQTLKLALEEIKKQIDTRFTILLPPKIVSFLDRISREKKLPKSVFIRNLIEERMSEEGNESLF